MSNNPPTPSFLPDGHLPAAAAHAAILLPGLGLAVPVLCWARWRDRSPAVGEQALQALLYQLCGVLYVALLAVGAGLVALAVLLATQADGRAALLAGWQRPAARVTAGLLAVYILPALAGAGASLSGRRFSYPYLGAWLRRSLAGLYDPEGAVPAQERWLAALAHASQMALVFGPLVPLAALLAARDATVWLRRQARQALVYQVSGLILAFLLLAAWIASVLPLLIAAGVLTFGSQTLDTLPPAALVAPFGCTSILLVLGILAWPVYATLPVLAMIRLLQGQDYRYPALGRRPSHKNDVLA
ncbi:MAG: DUF4870 domain-containing protein [Anaerolineaceae bacterium]|nr:DUF4870 domain-containing protein [Anaerolineaceae bacterium]